MSMVVWTRVVVMEVVENSWLWELFQGRVPRMGDRGCRGPGKAVQAGVWTGVVAAWQCWSRSSCGAECRFGFGPVGSEGGAEASRWRGQ